MRPSAKLVGRAAGNVHTGSADIGSSNMDRDSLPVAADSNCNSRASAHTSYERPGPDPIPHSNPAPDSNPAPHSNPAAAGH